MSGCPANVRQARKWVREHWAYLIDHADMAAVADIGNDHLDAIWSDECRKIAARLRGPSLPHPHPNSRERSRD